ncbi:MAG: hypothetical protein ACRD2L_04945 [Terriglobia bacterium]
MRRARNYLFSDHDLSAVLDAQRTAAIRAVEQTPRDQFLATSSDTLVESLVATYQIEPLVMHEDQMRMDQAETKVDVTGRFEYDIGRGGPVYTTGHELTFYIPFSGDPKLWHMKPNMWLSVTPRGDVDAHTSLLTITLVNTSNTEAERYKQELQSQLRGIRQLLESQAQMVRQFNSDLPNAVRSAVDYRRAQIEKLHGLAATFDIPMVKKSGMPEFRPVELVKKVARPLPRPPAAGFKPEPAISNELYEELLAIIRHAGASFEGAPQTYKPLGEEGLRDNILSHINVVFEGKATGETFRKYGKTDIRLEEETRSAFVGECKLWGGERALLEAVTQLLGYLTWRDCKAALVVFNKDVGSFSWVQATVAAALQSHPNFLRVKESGKAGEWRFVFRSSEDPAREVTVHVFVFNLYVAPERASKRR